MPQGVLFYQIHIIFDKNRIEYVTLFNLSPAALQKTTLCLLIHVVHTFYLACFMYFPPVHVCATLHWASG